MKTGFLPTMALATAGLLMVLFATPTNAQPTSKQAIREALVAMQYKDISISHCWISFARDLEPSEQNGLTSSYVRFFNLDYLIDFSGQEIQKIGQGQASFYGFGTRLDDNYPLSTRGIARFRLWVLRNYPGADWPRVHHSEQRAALPKIETYLAKEITNIPHFNRRVANTEYGKITEIEQFFRMIWREPVLLKKFLNAVSDYAHDTGCDIES